MSFVQAIALRARGRAHARRARRARARRARALEVGTLSGQENRRGQIAASPAELHKQTGGGDAYRVAMLDHGYVIPTAPWLRKEPGKRALQCGLTHDFNWTDWQRFNDGPLGYEARWCRTCATTQAREVTA